MREKKGGRGINLGKIAGAEAGAARGKGIEQGDAWLGACVRGDGG